MTTTAASCTKVNRMEKYIDHIIMASTSADDYARTLAQPASSSTSQTNATHTKSRSAAFGENLGTTRYRRAPAGRGSLSQTKTANCGPAEKTSSQTSADADKEDDDSDEMNLKGSNSPIGTPIRPVNVGVALGGGTPVGKLPKFLRLGETRGLAQQKPGNDENIHILSSSSSTESAKGLLAKPSSSRMASDRKLRTTQAVLSFPHIGARSMPTTKDIELAPRRSGNASGPSLSKDLAPESSHRVHPSSGAKGKGKATAESAVQPSRAQPFPLSKQEFKTVKPPAATKRKPSKAKDNPDANPVSVTAEERKARPHPMSAVLNPEKSLVGKGSQSVKDDETGTTKKCAQPFPMSLKADATVPERKSKKRSSSPDDTLDEAEDREEKKAKMAQPHPMAKQMKGNDQSKPTSSSSLASSSNRLSDSDREEERETRRRRIEA